MTLGFKLETEKLMWLFDEKTTTLFYNYKDWSIDPLVVECCGKLGVDPLVECCGKLGHFGKLQMAAIEGMSIYGR